ncbi:unnamed protein product [Heligmosomoides polygyrus]|uniref:Uncharacterized protein n=1 Tax=Heligmosomoides polygyrus TaxID=6339 RepID=A0A183FKL8_HELPZ|nr:unnamed protein product [Heligmosomoides polygyrus]
MMEDVDESLSPTAEDNKTGTGSRPLERGSPSALCGALAERCCSLSERTDRYGGHRRADGVRLWIADADAL